MSHPPGLEPERRYALDVVLGTILGLKHEASTAPRADVELTVPGEEGAVRVADVLFASGEQMWLTPATLPRSPVARLEGVPVLYAATGPGPDLGPGEEWLEADVFGAAFFMLTRYEELVLKAADEHERFPAEASVAHREGFLRRPVVHEYAELLWSRMSALWPRLERAGRPRTEVLPSHDVDWPFLPARPARAVARTLAGDALLRRDPALLARRLRWELARRRGTLTDDPFDTYDELMDLSEQAGVRSAFYFMAYSLAEPRVGEAMRRIHERGHEIGLHPSYGSFREAEVVAAELAALKETCAGLGIEQERWGGRQHFLRWENPVTWRIWDECGLDYDSSLAFADHVGFRTGACAEYPVFDLTARRPLRLRERPLIVMDGALERAARRDGVEAADLLDEVRAQCRRAGGKFTVLWHNHSLLTQRERDLYRRAVLG